jgi:hypothetical protein
MKKAKLYTILAIFTFSCIFFLVDPFKWWPMDHLTGKNRTPCASDDIRATCTGKITFFWQRP